MYPPNFDYYRAGSVDEALSLLQQHRGAKVLAGGHSLLPLLKMRLANPGVLVDIGRVDSLKGITTSQGTVRIGPLTTHAMIAASADVPAALAEAAGMVGDQQVRNRGTIGGNVSHADPASDLPTVLLALGATFHVKGMNGERAIAADDFFTGIFETALGEDEILTAVSVPAEGSTSGSAYAKMHHPASRYALVGAAASLTFEGGACTAARVAVGGLTHSATRAGSVESALVGSGLDLETITAASSMVSNDLGANLLGDHYASAEYRLAMAAVYVREAAASAAARAAG
jgi:carbon-monoxide dehydrogenase medium subunit